MSIPYAEVVGDPIAHSKSPVVHKFWLKKLRIEGDYRRCHVRAERLADYFAQRRADPDWRGCNVTIPHKKAVAARLDRLDPLARSIGAVNTVAWGQDANLVGYNTDASGFLEPLRPILVDRHLVRIARIIGTGGAAQAIAAALAAEGFVLVILGRDLAKAQALAAAFGPDHHATPIDRFADATDFAFDDRASCLDLVVNATSLGMAGQPPLAVDASHLPPGAIVYDIVYAPLQTALLAAARARGLRTIDGLRMLVGQAAVAFELFFGAPAPREHDDELRELLIE